MKLKIYFLFLACWSIGSDVFAQCPTWSIIFTSQEQIKEFGINYPDCKEVRNRLTIGYESGSTMSDIHDLTPLQNITGVGESLIIRNNPQLGSLNGLHHLAGALSDYIKISNNSSLTDLDGLEGLKEVGDRVWIENNAALINLDGLSGIQKANQLWIWNNEKLSSIQGIANLDPATLTELSIRDNKALSVCNVPNICTFLADNPDKGPSAISGNLGACQNFEAVWVACAFPLPCPAGDLTFRSQAQVDEFEAKYGHCSDLTVESLWIGDTDFLNPTPTDITSLSPLAGIGSIKRDLVVVNNPGLTSLEGLHGVKQIGGQLGIGDHSALLNLNGLRTLTTVGNGINIRNNSALTDISGLGNLVNFQGNVNIFYNPVLPDLNGLNGLTIIGGGLSITGNSALANMDGLKGVTTVGRYIGISNNTVLQNLEGLSGVTGIGEGLSILGNEALTHLDGLRNLKSLGLSPGSSGGLIEIRNNPRLSDISGLQNIDPATIGGDGLSITGNANLSLCNLSNICNYLGKDPGEYPRSVFGNGGNCATAEAVIAACATPPAPCPTGAVSFTSQDQVDKFGINYGHCTSIPYLVTVNGGDIDNLNGLSSVENIGYLYIGGTGSGHNPQLKNLAGLSSLKTLNSSLSISGNKALEDISALSGLTGIGENLFVVGNDVLPNLNGLGNVKNIGKTLSVEKNPLLKSLDGLSSLQQIGQNLQIVENASLENINAVSAVQSLQGLDISNNAVLGNVNGLSSLKTVNGFFNVSHNSLLLDISGFHSLETINEYMQFWMNSVVQDMSGFSGLKTVGGKLDISSNLGLKNLNGLGALETVGGELSLSYNPELENVNGLSGLKSIGGDLKVSNCDNLQSLTGLSGVQKIGGLLGVGALPALTSLQGLENIDPASVTNLMILQNGTLSVCNLPNICAYLGTDKPRTVSDNTGACADLAAVNAACGTSTLECPTGNLTFNKQDQIDKFGTTYGHCTVLPGNVLISGEDVENLGGLSQVQQIYGNLMIDETYLENLDGLAALESVNGSVRFFKNYLLKNLEGMSKLGSIGGYLNIQTGRLTSTRGLSALRSIGQYFYIWNNDDLKDLDGFTSLTGIGGDLLIENNPGLGNVNGLLSLTELGGKLTISSNGLYHLDGFRNLTGFNNEIVISGNKGLESIEGLKNIPADKITSLTIKDNQGANGSMGLSVCNLPNICAYLASNKPRTISGNLEDCATAAAVAASCTTPSATCPTGNIVLNSQELIDKFGTNYGHCRVIDGSLLISGALSDLNGLSNVEIINENLQITISELANLDGLSALVQVGGGMSIRKNPKLKNINGLASLKQIGAVVHIEENNVLENLDGLSALEELSWGGLIIQKNPKLENLNGLSALHTITGELNISSNAVLKNLNGLSALRSIGVDAIGGYLRIDQNPQLESAVLPSLESIAYQLAIMGNNKLQTMGFPVLKKTGGNVVIKNNAILKSVSGLEQLRELDFVEINGNAQLENLDGLSGLNKVNRIFILENALLPSIESLKNIEESTMVELLIVNNKALSVCNLPNICAYLRSGKLQTVSGNLGNCATADAVLTVCGAPPADCPTGDVTFISQAEIDVFRDTYGHCTILPGAVSIQGDDIVNLKGLTAVERIEGTLTIGSGNINNPSNLLLENLNGLSSLKHAGRIDIRANGGLKNIAALSSLQSVSGGFFIHNNPKLDNLEGLVNLQHIEGHLSINNNALLRNIGGFSRLESIGGGLYLYNNKQLENLGGLGSLKTINNGLTVYGNELLKDFQGLETLQEVGSMDIHENQQLKNFAGLSSLKTIRESVFVYSNPELENFSGLLSLQSSDAMNIYTNSRLKSLDGLEKLENISNLHIRENPQLTSIQGIENAIIEDLFIVRNPALSVCNLPNICAFLATDKPRAIYENLGACADEKAVKAACGSPVTLTLGSGVNPTSCGGTDGSISFTTSLKAGQYTLNFRRDSKDTTAKVTVANDGFTLAGLRKGTYSNFSITYENEVIAATGSRTLTEPASHTFALGTKTDPTGCNTSNGSIVFSTSLSSGSYELSFKKGTKDTTATVTVASGAFTLKDLSAAAYSAFSISNGGCSYTLAGPVELQSPVSAGDKILADGPTEFCSGSGVKLTAPEGKSYEWSTGAKTRSIQAVEGGIYKVKVTSSQGCVSESQITLTRKDCNVPPMAVCKPVVVLVVKEDCYAILRTEDLDAGSYDLNNDWFNRSIDINPALRVGSYTARMTVVDVHGASTTCASQVHVVDHSAPVVKARSLTLELNEHGRASLTVSDVDAGSYDNCGGLQLSLNRTEFDCGDLGHLQVILTGTDGSGNVSTALADIHVVDNTPPVVITKAMEIELNEEGKAVLRAEELAQSIQDNCGIWSIASSKTEFSCADLGEHTVILRVEDVQGGVTEAEVKVTVTDKMAPVLKAAPVTLYLDETGKAGLKAEEVGAGSTDNCGIAELSLSRSEFDCDDLGDHEVTLMGKDGSGNESEISIMITVADTTAPVMKAKDVTLELDEMGKATLRIEAVDDGSTDNCGIESRELQQTEFDCSHLGEQEITYTIRDKAGNSSTKAIKVTIKDVTAPVARATDGIVELDGEGKATLTAEQINDGSSDNCGVATLSISQSSFSCTDLGRRLVTLTVRDGSGNESTARAEVLIRDPEGVCPCSYGVLAEDKIVLKNNEVHSGGIGVSGRKGVVKLRNTEVSKEGTFVKSEQTRFDKESESSVYMRGRAPEPESFRGNDQKEKKREKIKKGETRTFAQGSYGRIKGKKDSKVVFSGGDVKVRSLKLKKGAQVSFSGMTALLVRDGIKLGRGVEFNVAGEQVKVYAGGDVKIGNESEVKGYVHSRGSLKTKGWKEKYLEGFFAADRIRGGRNTEWSGGGVLCTAREDEVLLAGGEKRDRVREAAAEALGDTVEVDSGSLRVRLWPNPVSSYLRAEIGGERAGGRVILVDLLGNVLRQVRYEGREEVVEMNVEQLQAGLYVLRVESGSEVVTLRVVKKKL